MNKEGYKKTELGYLPLDWDVKKLGEITNNVTIGLVKTMTAHYCEQGVPLIRNSNIKEDKIDKENMVFLTYEFAEANENKKLKVGDIVTVHTGDIGTSAVIEKDMDGAHGFATLNTTVNPEIIYNYYLSKYFNSNMYKKQAMSFSTGDGRFNLNLKDFVNSLIPIPPLKEQKKIAEILSSVDAAIEKTEQVIAKTEEVKKGLMQQLLTKGIGHTEFKQTEIGEIPVEWDVQKLGEIANNVTIGLVKTMTAHYCEQGVPLIRNSNIKEDKIDKENMVFLTYEFAEANENKKLKVGDIVTVHTGDIGTSAVIEKDMDGAHGFATLNTTVNPEIIYNYYLSKYFNSNMYKKQAMSFSTGDGRFNLNLKDFINSLIPIPSLKEQQKIAEILSSVDAAIEKTEQVIAKMEEVKKGLMQQLLTGQVRVKID